MCLSVTLAATASRCSINELLFQSGGDKLNIERLYLITNVLKPVPSATLRCVDRKTGKDEK